MATEEYRAIQRQHRDARLNIRSEKTQLEIAEEKAIQAEFDAAFKRLEELNDALPADVKEDLNAYKQAQVKNAFLAIDPKIMVRGLMRKLSEGDNKSILTFLQMHGLLTKETLDNTKPATVTINFIRDEGLPAIPGDDAKPVVLEVR